MTKARYDRALAVCVDYCSSVLIVSSSRVVALLGFGMRWCRAPSWRSRRRLRSLLLLTLLLHLLCLLDTVGITRRNVVFRALEPRLLRVAGRRWLIDQRRALYLRNLRQGRRGSIADARGIVIVARDVADAWLRRDRSTRNYAATRHVATLRVRETC